MVDKIKLLNKIGLTEGESKVYLALLQNGKASGYEAAKLSGVPRSKIYNLLETLINKGFVVYSEIDGSLKYASVQMEEVAERVERETKETLCILKSELKDYQKETDMDAIWHIREYANVIAKCRSLIRHTREELLLQIWDEELDLLADEIRGLEAAEVPAGVVVFSNREELPITHYRKHGMLNEKKKEMGGRWITLVSDRKEAVFGQILSGEVAEVIWTKSRPMITMAAEYARHDMYFYKSTELFGEEMQQKLGEDYVKVREIF